MLTQTLSQTNLEYSYLVAFSPQAWRPSRRLLKILLDSDPCFIDALRRNSRLSKANYDVKVCRLKIS
jgi:hypothetical protein